MKVHLVGGFLGSGKTTAIAAAAKQLLSAGKRVGVITNDQGKYLVDTAFFSALDVPAVEVTGGCFCCNYDDLDARLSHLEQQYRPDVIFAESVGSCADVIATVIKPLLQLSAKPASLSVFADSRLLLRRLQGGEMPFTDDVVYIFDKQLEEAGLIVINKVDLLDEHNRQALRATALRSFPGKALLMHSAHNTDDIRAWIDTVESGKLPALEQAVDIDYARYGSGEAELAWLDAQIELALPQPRGRELLRMFLVQLLNDLRASNSAIGHLKLMLDDGVEQSKISITTADGGEWEGRLPAVRGSQIRLLLNIRAAAEAHRLEAAARHALESALHDARITRWEAQHFHPGVPRPTHRLT